MKTSKNLIKNHGSYFEAVYFYGINKEDECFSEPFKVLDQDNYQSVDNNAICFKHIDYTLNKNAKTFKDIFEFEQVNKDIASNLKANSCYFNLLLATYKEAIENVYVNDERVYKDLTVERLCEILQIENKDQDLGLSIRASVKFFEKFHLNLVVVNIYDEVIFKYPPKEEQKKSKIAPRTLYVLVYNNHCFRLNSNENSFVHKLNLKEVHDVDKEDYENLKNSISTKFYFRNFDKEGNKIFINNSDDVIEHIVNNSDNKTINFITNTDLTEILFQMLDNKYTPYVSFDKGVLSRLCFKVKQNEEDEAVLYSIQYGDSSMVENEIMDVQENEITEYDKADRNMYEWLLNKNNMSQRNEYVRDIESKYQMAPLSGYFDGCDMKMSYNTIDINKAYTSNLKDIRYFPVFSVFDIFLKYDGHAIEDYTQYIVQCNDVNNETSVLFRKKYSRCYGYKLNRISNIKYTVLYYRRPSKLNETNSKQHIEDLFNSKISDDPQEDITKKKFIANKNMGLIEKKYNSKFITKIYQTLAEAQYYQIKYGGFIYKVSNRKYEDVDPTEEEIKQGVEYKASLNERKVFLLVNKFKKHLDETFNPMKDLIYDIQLLKLWQLYKKLEDNNINVYGIKTDCLLVREDDQVLNDIFHFNKDIGGVKFESGKNPINKKIAMVANDLIEFKQPVVNIIKLKDEWDVYEMKEVLQKYDRVFISANLPGSGKTTATKNSGYVMEFVTPYNKLCQELRKEKYDSVTLNKLLNINIVGDHNKKAKQHDASKYEAICFDEIKLYGPHYLAKIYDFMTKNDKKNICHW